MSIETSRANTVQEFEVLSLNEKLQEVKNVLGEQASYTLPEEKTITKIDKESYPSFIYIDPQDDYQRERNAIRDVTRYTIYFEDGSTKILTRRQSRQGPLLS